MIANSIHDNVVSITPSGFFGNSVDNIVEIENFSTKEELDFLENAARKITIWDKTETRKNNNGTIVYEANYWQDRVATRSSLDKNDIQIVPQILVLIKRIQPIIENFFSVIVKPTSPTIVRWLPGQLQNPHADKELHEGPDAGRPNDFPYYDLSSLFYLNDDYEGGELYFPKQGVEFKPKKGSAYFFPGDMNYIHGVKEVKSGIRYTCPLFWTILKHTEGQGVC